MKNWPVADDLEYSNASSVSNSNDDFSFAQK